MNSEFVVYLDKMEISQAIQSGGCRSQLSQLSGKSAPQVDKCRSNDDVHIEGMKAEMAVSKIFQLEHNPYAFGIDTGQDLWCDNKSIDVKATKYATGKLIFRNLNVFKADIAVLAIVDGYTIKVVGGCTRDFFVENHVMEKLNPAYPPTATLDQKKLSSVEDIWKMLTIPRLNTRNFIQQHFGNHIQ